MAQHEILLNLPEVSIANSDASFDVYEDKELLGRIKVSRGTIEWVPSGYRSGVHINWDDFDRLMKKHGYRR
ncbi:MAG: hypothetical protein WEC59_10980 [Salibacteraceae bacterium]